ncbi:MAG: hypothetical protein HY298_24060 [Verrucomicrobia bacterium]|nr:hypothetical protein [Verrucomicrobiota bacterium]
MKKSFFLCLMVGLTFVGCGKNSDKPAQSTNSATSGNPLTAPVDYLGAIGKAQKNAVKTIDTVSLNQAIQLFNTQEGRNPKDLNELVEKKYLGQIPDAPYGMKIVYDASSGQVKVVKQ